MKLISGVKADIREKDVRKQLTLSERLMPLQVPVDIPVRSERMNLNGHVTGCCLSHCDSKPTTTILWLKMANRMQFQRIRCSNKSDHSEALYRQLSLLITANHHWSTENRRSHGKIERGAPLHVTSGYDPLPMSNMCGMPLWLTHPLNNSISSICSVCSEPSVRCTSWLSLRFSRQTPVSDKSFH